MAGQISDEARALIGVLRELHDIAPDYRFGQSIYNLSFAIMGYRDVSVDIKDEVLLNSARNFVLNVRGLSESRQKNGVPLPSDALSMTETLLEQQPGLSVYSTLMEVLTVARSIMDVRLYDIEDELYTICAKRLYFERLSQLRPRDLLDLIYPEDGDLSISCSLLNTLQYILATGVGVSLGKLVSMLTVGSGLSKLDPKVRLGDEFLLGLARRFLYLACTSSVPPQITTPYALQAVDALRCIIPQNPGMTIYVALNEILEMAKRTEEVRMDTISNETIISSTWLLQQERLV